MKKSILTLSLIFSVLFAWAQASDSTRVVFGELKGEGPYSRSDVILQNGLTVSSGDGHQYEVIKYKMILAPKKGSAMLLSGNTATFTENTKQHLYKLVVGDKVIIESISAKVDGDSSNIVTLAPLMFTVGQSLSTINYDGFEKDNIERKNKDNTPVAHSAMPRATFGTLDLSSDFTLEDILSQSQILVNADVDYQVTQFKLIAAYKNSPPVMAATNGNNITLQMKEILAKMVSGDRILVEGIAAVATVDGVEYKIYLSPIVFSVP
jgi:preprotein translocase subunit YajC